LWEFYIQRVFTERLAETNAQLPVAFEDAVSCVLRYQTAYLYHGASLCLAKPPGQFTLQHVVSASRKQQKVPDEALVLYFAIEVR